MCQNDLKLWHATKTTGPPAKEGKRDYSTLEDLSDVYCEICYAEAQVKSACHCPLESFHFFSRLRCLKPLVPFLSLFFNYKQLS